MKVIRIEFVSPARQVLKVVDVDANGLTSQNSNAPITVRISIVENLCDIEMPPVAK